MSFRLAVVILAAGQSRRYGGNKYLASHPAGKTLIEHVVTQYEPLSPEPVTVVTGAWHDAIQPLFDSRNDINVIHNTKWDEGMASSLKCAIHWYESQRADITHLLFAPADQAAITSASLQPLLAKAFLQQEKVVASYWENRAGSPAIFPAAFWHELLLLEGDRGAQSLLSRWLDATPARCVCVEHPEAAKDIDTPDDWIDSTS